jgi:catechol 2,3-dioxygenase-like lactoylglutathione lyase family enzyme
MAVTRLNHVNVSVSDMDQAIAFWQQGLGLALTGRGTVSYPHLDAIVGLTDTTIEWAELDLPAGGIVELFRYHRPAAEPVQPAVNRPGTTHVALEVDDLDAQLRQLGPHARRIVAEPVTIPFGDWAGWRSVYVEEPNGVTVELLQRP